MNRSYSRIILLGKKHEKEIRMSCVKQEDRMNQMQIVARLGCEATIFGLMMLGCASAPHGENKMGPHGGYIRMPGEFHVEVVPQRDHQLMVYLLDLQSRNPLTLASMLKGQLRQKGRVQPFTCDVMADHYRCKLPDDSDLTSGEISLQSVRKERVGRPAVFRLPFELPEE